MGITVYESNYMPGDIYATYPVDGLMLNVTGTKSFGQTL
jgi:hypothetical protein